MRIECPVCKRAAQLADAQEGAKVRCPQCAHVYVARRAGAHARRSRNDPVRYAVIAGAAVALAGLSFYLNSARGPRSSATPTPPAERAAEAPPEPTTGWDAPPVRAARALHDAAHALDRTRLRDLVDGELVLERLRAEGGGDPASMPASWDAASADERVLFLGRVASSIATGADRELLGDWLPYACGGEQREGVLSLEGGRATVQLRTRSRADATLPDRIVEVALVERDGRWRAWSWKHVLAAETAPPPPAPPADDGLRELSDGSIVREGELRPIPHADDTPPELRARIDALVAAVVDLATPAKALTAARAELETIGKPAIPALLTKLAEIPLDTEEHAIQLNVVCDLLQRITGHVTSFAPSEAMGESEERRRSGLAQWFGWYDAHFADFTGKPAAAEDLEPVNEQERELLERQRRQREIEEILDGEGDGNG